MAVPQPALLPEGCPNLINRRFSSHLDPGRLPMIRRSIKKQGTSYEKNFIARSHDLDAGRRDLCSRREGSGRRTGRRRSIQLFAGAVLQE